MGGMASAAADDVKIGLGLKDDPGPTPRDDMAGRKSSYQRRTAATVAAQDALGYRKGAGDAERERQRQSAPPRAAPAPNYNIGAVAAAPSVPNPDAIGETEQALLDAQKKGRSSTIATSAKGLLAGDDSTSKKRSLMGSLIT